MRVFHTDRGWRRRATGRACGAWWLRGRRLRRAWWRMVLLCLLAALAVWLSLVMRSRGLRGIGGRLELLLGGGDWLWIGLLGLVLPVGACLLLAKFGPSSGREFGPRVTGFIVPLLQAGCLPGLIWLSLAQAVSWRVRRRGGILGFGPRWLWPGWVVVLVGWIGVAMPGVALRWSGVPVWLPWVAVGLGGLALVWVLVAAGRALFGRHRRALERLVSGLVLLPWLVLAAASFAVMVPLLEWEERYWLAREELMRTESELPSIGGYEWRVTQAAREEMLEVLK